MDWLFARFGALGRARGRVVCYLRENGPIAYSVDVFARDARERAGALLAADLAWYWRTIGEGSVREWTRRTAWSLAALLADVGEPGAGSPLALIGIDGADAPADMDDAHVAQVIRGFDAGADRPLHGVVVRRPPEHELLFVAQHPPESVLGLLQAWGIDRDKAERRAYARLRDRSLAALARSLSPSQDTGVRS